MVSDDSEDGIRVGISATRHTLAVPQSPVKALATKAFLAIPKAEEVATLATRQSVQLDHIR